MFQSVTDFKLCVNEPKRDCPQCRAIGSASKVEARTRMNIFIAKIAIASEFIWRCKVCGWNSPPTTSPEGGPMSLFQAPQQPVGELNHMYRNAEIWHRPPSIVNEAPMKMPPLQGILEDQDHASPNESEHAGYASN